MLKKFKMRRGSTDQIPLTLPSTKKSDDIERFATTGCGWLQRPDRDKACRHQPTHGHRTYFICRGSLPLLELPEKDCYGEPRQRLQMALRDKNEKNLDKNMCNTFSENSSV